VYTTATEPMFVTTESALTMLASARMIGTMNENAMILELICYSNGFMSTEYRRNDNENCVRGRSLTESERHDETVGTGPIHTKQI
jgi:hypothetical protein